MALKSGSRKSHRGGRHMKRRIKPVVSLRSQPVITKACNFSNLIPVPLNYDLCSISSIPVVLNTRNDHCITNRSTSNLNNLLDIPKHNNKQLNIRLWNARSACNKTVSIYDNIIENDVDIIVITETWLTESDPVIIGEMLPEGYSFLNFPRKGDAHGGIGIIHKLILAFRAYLQA